MTSQFVLEYNFGLRFHVKATANGVEHLRIITTAFNYSTHYPVCRLCFVVQIDFLAETGKCKLNVLWNSYFIFLVPHIDIVTHVFSLLELQCLFETG